MSKHQQKNYNAFAFFILLSIPLLTYNQTMALDNPDKDWPNTQIQWPQYMNLSQLLEVKDANDDVTSKITVDVDTLIRNSDEFNLKFPINVTKTAHLKQIINNNDSNNLERNINSAYPLLHENMLKLYVSFLEHKARFGSKIERDIYQNMTVIGFIDRILSKRAASFYGIDDNYLLITGMKGKGGWEKVGITDNNDESIDLKLKDVLSYEEIKLSSHLSVSSSSYFINEGSKDNSGRYENDRSKIEDYGFLIQIAGPRLDKELVMDYREIIKSKNMTTHLYGFGQFFLPTTQGIFMNFYGKASLTYDDLELGKHFENENYVKIDDDKYFDKEIYEKRINLDIDTLLFDANKRAEELGKIAFVYVSGFGLEQPEIIPHQKQLFLSIFINRIRFLGEKLSRISDIYFPSSIFDDFVVAGAKSGDKIPIAGHPQGGIKIDSGSKSPHEKLTGDDTGKLLVVSYPGNGNALPGNEFWINDLTASGAAAEGCSSQITELHNPHINPKITARNVRIVTISGIFGLKDYVKLKNNNQDS